MSRINSYIIREYKKFLSYRTHYLTHASSRKICSSDRLLKKSIS